jgi:predicted small lipoprotein YifL
MLQRKTSVAAAKAALVMCASALSLSLLGGCGQKGPLMLAPLAPAAASSAPVMSASSPAPSS